MFDENHFKKYTCANPSELGLKVARFVSDVVGGFHRIEPYLRDKVDWTNTYYIAVPWPSNFSLSTVDYNKLTKIVVLSHDRMLRVEINPRHYRWLELVFHERKTRDGRLCERMPTMESHVAAIRSNY